MTDVIREKKPKEERSLNQMKASLENDFGEMISIDKSKVIAKDEAIQNE